MKRIIVLICLLLIVGCKPTIKIHGNITTGGIAYFNESPQRAYIAFFDDKAEFDGMNCSVINCSSDLCLQCKIDDKPVNFSAWFW